MGYKPCAIKSTCSHTSAVVNPKIREEDTFVSFRELIWPRQGSQHRRWLPWLPVTGPAAFCALLQEKGYLI